MATGDPEAEYRFREVAQEEVNAAYLSQKARIETLEALVRDLLLATNPVYPGRYTPQQLRQRAVELGVVRVQK